MIESNTGRVQVLVVRVVEQLGRDGVERPRNGRGELASRRGRELDRDAGRRAEHRGEEVDVERVVGRRVHGVVEVDRRGCEAEPTLRSLAAARQLDALGGVGAHAGSLSAAGQDRWEAKKLSTLRQPSTAASWR